MEHYSAIKSHGLLIYTIMSMILTKVMLRERSQIIPLKKLKGILRCHVYKILENENKSSNGIECKRL